MLENLDNLGNLGFERSGENLERVKTPSGLRESIDSRNFRKSTSSRHLSLVLRKPRGYIVQKTYRT